MFFHIKHMSPKQDREVSTLIECKMLLQLSTLSNRKLESSGLFQSRRFYITRHVPLSTQSHLTTCYASRHYKTGRVISAEGIGHVLSYGSSKISPKQDQAVSL